MISTTMMHKPLLVSSILTYAEKFHSEQEIVSRTVEGEIFRYTYIDLGNRAKRLANVLEGFDIPQGSCVASLAWNTHRHLELYYGVSGSGYVLHTVNPRLSITQIAYMMNQANDTVLFFDTSFSALVNALKPLVPKVLYFVALCSDAHLPAAPALKPLSYEALLSDANPIYEWPDLDENLAAGICYTSGTTGSPKGVVYSHRSNVLHAMAMCMPDVSNFRSTDTVLPIVPMFHVNAWGVPFAVPMVGAKLVLPGPRLDPAGIYELAQAEQVTMTTGVPAILQGLLHFIEKENLTFTTMRTAIVGGAACPPSMISRYRDLTNLTVYQGWGMTETSPIASVSKPKAAHGDLSKEAFVDVLAMQGRPLFGVDMKVVDTNGKELPWDGQSAGELQVNGLWISGGYLGGEDADRFTDGWFKTGDVATINALGCMRITDRTKDVIKSGGEWISSIELENIALDHPNVAMAAVVGLAHPKWDERPLLIVVAKPDATIDSASLLNSFTGRVERWALPEDIVQINAMPIGATGKILKTELRTQFKNHFTQNLSK
jgi:3-(methylthio)propionyl---CoA ligase